jgi:hypothetical protein
VWVGKLGLKLRYGNIKVVGGECMRLREERVMGGKGKSNIKVFY